EKRPGPRKLQESCGGAGAAAKLWAMAAKLIVLGAGKIGQAIVNLLSATGDYDLTVVDSDAAALERLSKFPARTENVNFTDKAALRRAIEGNRFAVSASPFHFTQR